MPGRVVTPPRPAPAATAALPVLLPPLTDNTEEAAIGPRGRGRSTGAHGQGTPGCDPPQSPSSPLVFSTWRIAKAPSSAAATESSAAAAATTIITTVTPTRAQEGLTPEHQHAGRQRDGEDDTRDNQMLKDSNTTLLGARGQRGFKLDIPRHNQ